MDKIKTIVREELSKWKRDKSDLDL